MSSLLMFLNLELYNGLLYYLIANSVNLKIMIIYVIKDGMILQPIKRYIGLQDYPGKAYFKNIRIKIIIFF